ncbi:YcnI family protein [Mumia sp. ZJ1417]|uniref:YcnI family copper-binding membrane protein n=1 Tax=Mumia sp. ZJ1417 TaxID=2708082 RepID=UPI00141DE4A2|nr:YcnI family protein [Mumia sp. ZJ1417]QMW68093.1 YcnI family protein [Mumia sp. ZJ1417]
MNKLVLPSGMLAGAAALVLATAAPASAHVGVDAPDAAKGGWATLSFRVPTESDTASTTALTVAFPEGADFEYVATKTKPGWTVSKVEGTSVTWTAEKGTGIAPGEFDVFDLRVGPLPTDVDTLTFPATQTYSDGTTAAWDQPTPESGEEPDRPAPVVALADAEDGHGAHGATDAETDDDAAESEDSGGVDGWLVGGIAVLALAVGALVASLVRRGPRSR